MSLDFDRANVSLSTQQNILSNKFKEKGRGERGWVQKKENEGECEKVWEKENGERRKRFFIIKEE